MKLIYTIIFSLLLSSNAFCEVTNQDKYDKLINKIENIELTILKIRKEITLLNSKNTKLRNTANHSGKSDRYDRTININRKKISKYNSRKSELHAERKILVKKAKLIKKK